MVQWLQSVLQNLGFQVSDAPTPIYEDSKPKINILKANHLTSRVKYTDAPVNYSQEKYVLLNIDPVKLKTTLRQQTQEMKFP